MALPLSPQIEALLEKTYAIDGQQQVSIQQYRELLVWLKTLTIGSGSGDVVGPASATDRAIALYDGATGKLIQDSLMTVSPAGSTNIPAGEFYLTDGKYYPLGVIVSSGDFTGNDYTNALLGGKTPDTDFLIYSGGLLLDVTKDYTFAGTTITIASGAVDLRILIL